MRIVVVFPQPDGPSRTKNSPSWIIKSTPSTALTSPKCFFRPRVSTTDRCRDVGGACDADPRSRHHDAQAGVPDLRPHPHHPAPPGLLEGEEGTIRPHGRRHLGGE